MTKEKSRLLFFSLIALGAVALFITLISRTVFKTQGAESNVDIEIVPSSGKMPDETISFIIKPQKSSDKIEGADIRLSLENAKITSWEGCSQLSGGDNSIFTELVSDPVGARYACQVFKKDSELPSAIVIKAKATCAGGGSGKIKINTSTSQVAGPVTGVLFGFGNLTEASFDCGGTTETKNDVTTSFDPASLKGKVKEKLTYTLKVASNDESKKISGYYVKLSFNPLLINALNIDGEIGSASGKVKGLLAQVGPGPAVPTAPVPASRTCTSTADCIANFCTTNPTCGIVCAIPAGAPTGVCVGSFAAITPVPTAVVATGAATPTIAGPIPSGPIPPITVEPLPSPTGGAPSGKCEVISSHVDNEKGTLEYIFGCNKPVSELTTSYSNVLAFEGIKDGSGELTISDIQVIGPQGAPVYTTSLGKASYEIGEGDGDGKGGKVDLNMKLRLQCILSKPTDGKKITARIGVGDGKLKEPVYKKVEFTVDDNGFWNGSASFDVSPGKGYKLYTKGNMHIQKKICEAQPKEDFPGAYSCDKGKIELKDKTDIDMSKIVQLSGDLAGDDQDGVVNAYDMTKIRLCLGKKDETCVKNADINHNNMVETNDYACALAALAVRWDEQ